MRLVSRSLLRNRLIKSGMSIVDRCFSFLAGGFTAARQPTPVPVPVLVPVSSGDHVRNRRSREIH